jgi:hypothetical protein
MQNIFFEKIAYFKKYMYLCLSKQNLLLKVLKTTYMPSLNLFLRFLKLLTKVNGGGIVGLFISIYSREYLMF